MTSRLHAVFLVLFGLAASVAAQELPPAKQVAAPAADILAGVVRLPDPGELVERSRSALLEVAFERAGEAWVSELELPVEALERLSLAAASADVGRWRILVEPPGGAWIDLESVAGVERRSAGFGVALASAAVARFDLARPAAGLWRVRVEVTDGGERPADGWLALAGDPGVQLGTRLSTLELLADERIGVTAFLVDATRGAPAPLARGLAAVELVTESALGLARAPMRDDGLHADGAPGDGVFGAWLPPGTSGEVRARVVARGSGPDGRALVRTSQRAFHVLERAAVLSGEASARVEGPLHLAIELGATLLAPVRRLHVSAEVWGRDAEGDDVPVAWLSRIVSVDASPGEALALPLTLDLRWLALERARAPLELREVRVQDVDTHVPFDRLPRLSLPTPVLPPAASRPPAPITQDMLFGVAPGPVVSLPPADEVPPRALRPALALVHGYCSGGSPWPAAHFSEPKLAFLDPSANRSHDEFAVLLAQQTSALSSFGVVAHSQGGPAALHLLTYYHTGLDRAAPGRRIQSVGAPYQGTPLASWGGFACGVNDDMTPSGSATWLAGIPSWARAEVFYWTTSESGSACQFFTDFLLADPEDGTVERSRGQLPGGNDMGHAIGWCHTTGMTNPAQYTDPVRNAEMDAAAAR